MSGDWCLVVEGSPDVFTTAGVTSISSYSDATPASATVRAGVLGSVDVTISERLRPLEGTCEISALDFVLHDAGGYVANNFTRGLDEHALTFLTASLTSSATTMTVQNASALGSLPRVVWVAKEAIQVDSIAAGNTVNVARARYGTAARAVAVDATRAEQPRVYSYPCWMSGRRVRLYRVSAGVATLRWVGYVAQGPIRSENGASWTVSCISSLEQEARNRWGSPQPAATLSGYNARAFRFDIIIDDGTVHVYQDFGPSTVRRGVICGSYREALERALKAIATAAATAGATDVIASPVSIRDGQAMCALQYNTLARGDGVLSIGADEFYSAQVFENSGITQYIWKFPVDDGGALVLAGTRLATNSDPYTTIAPHASMASSWTATAGSQGDTQLVPMLVGDVSDDMMLELDPTGMSTPGVTTNDTTNTVKNFDTSNGVTTFSGRVRLLSKDPAATGDPSTARNRHVTVKEALPLRSEVRASSSHWLDAVRSILENTTLGATRSDTRNWGWSDYARTRRETHDSLGAVEYRTNGNSTVGELVAGEAALRGACIAVDGNGLLTVLHVRAPQADDVVANTITTGDLIRESVTRVAPSDDGLLTEVVYSSPVRTVTLQDAVALGQYDAQRSIEVSTQSFRRESRLVNDPVGFALAACGKLLTKWRAELWVYSMTVPAYRFASTCTLGAVVAFDSYNAPNRSGGIGFTAKRGTVIGRSEDTATGELVLDILELPQVYGFSPACRVSSISSATLSIAGTYAGDASDYAGSTLTGYRKTASDRGVGWFAAGDKVRLVLRDTTTSTVESYTVASVDTAAKTITMTSAIAAAPTNWSALVAGGGIVDVVYDNFATSVAAQRVFAAVADETTRTITSGVAARRWAP